MEVSRLNTYHLHVISTVWANWNHLLGESLQKGESIYDIISSLITVKVDIYLSAETFLHVNITALKGK